MSQFFPTIYQQFIYVSRYSKYIESKSRRETWSETVSRYFDHFEEFLKENHDFDMGLGGLRDELEEAVLSLRVMPSMRALMTAGPALKRDHGAGFNCSAIAISNLRDFSEALYVLMLGCGLGFSVESSEVGQIPSMPDEFYDTGTTVVFEDSKLGWAKGLNEWLHLLASGQLPKYDVSKIRPKGARLKTFGGRASGGGVLIDLLEFTKDIFKKAAGRKLTSLECHDIVCKIADIVICGGVRRCCKNTTRIQTKNGFKQIKDVFVGDMIVTGGKEYSVTEHVYSGKQKTIRIHHKFGVIDGVTEEHRIAVFDSMNNYSFKKAKCLLQGDVLVWDGYGIDGKIQQFPNFVENNHFNAKKIIFPEYLNEDLAWLFGLIHGDGYVGPRGNIEISKNDDEWEMLNKANCIFLTYFGISGQVNYDGKGGRGIRLRINSKALTKWILDNLKKPHEDICIPNFIFGAERQVRLAYLMGLFDSDGRVTPDGGIDQCTSIYKSFKNDIVTLLSTLGIGSKVYFGSAENRRRMGVKAKDYYTIRIVGLTNRNKWKDGLVFSKSFKKEQIKDYVGTHNDFSWPAVLHRAEEYSGHSMSLTASLEKDIIDIKSSFYPSIITEIEVSDQEEDTFDIAVENVHQFSADGIIMHNSATISLSDLNDNRMREAKTGAWWQVAPYRRLANNSAIYEEDPDIGTFMNEWISLYESKSGERGIFSRKAAKHAMENANKFRKDNFGEKIRVRDTNFKVLVNPCCEIFLRDDETCNLTSVQIRENDTLKSLKEKVRVATILGTFQSCLTNFKYVNKKWQRNAEDERLLGVSLNGIFDNSLTNGKDGVDKLKTALVELKKVAITINTEYAAKLGINVSAAIMTVKPEGTTSALNGTSSGIHPAHATYYFRHVRNDIKDPVTQFMIDSEIPYEKDHYDPTNMVTFKFPMKSAKNAVFRKDLSPIDHLELWKLYQEYWAEHKPSVTISVKESEWLDVGAWVFKNFEWMSGVSFLPYSDHVYTQAPFEECTKAQYDELLARMPSHIDWEKLTNYEKEDATTSSQELACTASPEGCFV